MIPKALIRQLRERQVVLFPCGDKIRWRAPKGAITLELKSEIRKHKDELLAQARSSLCVRHRWGSSPPRPLSLAVHPPQLSEKDRDLVRGAINRQPIAVFHWILGNDHQQGQADRYGAEKHWPWSECNMAAAVDCLLWQREWQLKDLTRPQALQALLQELADTEDEVRRLG